MLLAWVLLYIDANTGAELPGPLKWLKARDAESIRTLLATTAGSVVTIVSVVFSITIVVLTLAASQLGPRLLRNFMRDHVTQFSLGVFIATYIYCIIVLHTSGLFSDAEHLPNIAAFAALILTIFSLAVLIYFIHHTATMIQAPSIIARVSSQLRANIARTFPETEPDESAGDWDHDCTQALVADSEGYLQAIDYSGLLDFAAERDLALDMHCRPGDYIIPESTLAHLTPCDLDEQTVQELRDHFIIATRRTDTQDVRYGVYELVEVAMRALSPGINDPITALNCVDRLGGVLANIGGRADPPVYRRDDAGRVRLRLRVTRFADVADAAINQVRQHARDNVAVTIRLLEMFAMVAPYVKGEDRRAVLLRQARIIRDAAADIPDEPDRRDIEAAYETAAEALNRA